MPSQTRLAVIYYSSTGHVHRLATALAEGAADAGADVRVRKVPELAPRSVIDTQPAWREHLDATADVPEATHEDLLWADAVAFGTPTRFGNVAAQLKQFLDTTGGLWAEGSLADKVYSGFVTTQTLHGGQESTLLALYNTIYHFGGIIVPPGYTHPIVAETGGNPYGTSYALDSGDVTDKLVKAAGIQGARMVAIASRLAATQAPTAA